MLSDKIRHAAVTLIPLSLSALAFLTLKHVCDAHLFGELPAANAGALVLIVAVHLLAPIWAATRPNWWTAACAQVVLVGVNDWFWLDYVLTGMRDAQVSDCGMAGAMLCLATFVGFLLYVPLSLVSAWAIKNWLVTE